MKLEGDDPLDVRPRSRPMTMDQQLVVLRTVLAKIATETFDPWAKTTAEAVLEAMRPGA